MNSKASRLKQVLLDRIISGRYPVGKQLPGLRSLASEFDVHANTVAKVYGELTALGILRTSQGRGTYVVEFPEARDYEDAKTAMYEMLKTHAVQARHLGLSLSDWTDLACHAGEHAFPKEDTRVWFVECNLQDTAELAESLGALLHLSVSPLLVQNLQQVLTSLNRDRDVVVTTPFHIEEVDGIIEDRAHVASVNIVPTSETLIQFARIPRESNVSLICSNRETLKRFEQMTIQYTRREPAAMCLVSDPQALSVIQGAEILIDSQSIHPKVLGMGPTGHLITVRYQIEPTSLAFLREVLKRRTFEMGTNQGQPAGIPLH